MPGKKDFVSVKNILTGKKEHKQKRLILCNLKELYIKFRETHDMKIGFSTFCTLRPKWCIPVNSAGTHSVCVCIYHQNVQLLVNACSFDKDYHELTEIIVCSRENRDCMIHRCSKCPGIEPLKKYLLDQLTEKEDIDSNDETDDYSGNDG